jgi:hypothetical protein
MFNTLTGNNAGGRGGAIDSYSSSHPLIHGNKILNNSATRGGGIGISESYPLLSSNLLVGNDAVLGGGIYASSPQSGAQVVNNTITANIVNPTTLTPQGSGLYQSGGSLTVINSILWGNTGASEIYGTPVVTNSNVEGGYGANLNLDPQYTDILAGDYSLLPSSPCINAGVADTIGLKIPATDLDELPRISGCRIDMGAYESQSQVGGPIAADTTWSSDTVYVNCDIDILDGATLTIEPGVNVIFNDSLYFNVQGRLLALGNSTDSIKFTSSTGVWQGITFDSIDYAGNDTSIVSHCVIEGGVKAEGGGIAILSSDEVRIENSLISQCTGVDFGGGIYIDNSKAVISGTILRDNTGGLGGGIYTRGGNPVLTSNTLISNTANTGAGIRVFYGDPEIINNSVYGNAADAVGGGIALAESNATVTDNLVENNTANSTNGGGLYISGGAPLVSTNDFIQNAAQQRGGGIYLANSGARIANNILYQNQAVIWDGGGIWVSGGNPLIHANTISENTAHDWGGGIGLSGGSAVVVNNVITGNSIADVGGVYGHRGGGIYLENADFNVNNNTITDNLATEGGGVFIGSSSPSFSNNIIWGNTAGASGPAVVINFASSSPVFEYCDIEGDSSAFAGAGSGAAFTGTYSNNINVDPQFNAAASGDYTLSMTSPCLNSGTPDTTGLGLEPLDLNGGLRVSGCTIDMGAYEEQSLVGGLISGNVTWSGDTVKVICDVNIENGATLNIEPGVNVVFMGHYSINVQGRILAVGEDGYNIRFTVADTSGYSSDTHTAWGGIRFENTPVSNDTSVLKYCIIECIISAILNNTVL